MKKMPCLFVREFHGPRSATITEVVTPGCEWVLAGEGVASIKRDGTACAVIGGVLHKRYDAKAGKLPPEGAIPCDPYPDATTGHWPHWIRVVEGDPGSRWHLDALSRASLTDGTYELVGPKINGNPDGFVDHCFVRHGEEVVEVPRTFDGLRDFLCDFKHEGVVFKHDDGRRCKIRRADFGFVWPMAR
jgi:hypothetical protein